MKAGTILITAGVLLFAIQFERFHRPWPPPFPVKKVKIQVIEIGPVEPPKTYVVHEVAK